MASAAHGKLNAAREVLEEAEREIRNAIYDLHSPILDAVGLVPALQKYASRFEDLSGIVCHVSVMGTPCRLPEATEVAVFRMVEEALQNVAAHSEARAASVVMEFEPILFCATVQDDGHGFDYRRWMEIRNGKHLGLLGMQERVGSLGGKMEVWSEPGRGTRVLFRLPIQRDANSPVQ